MTAYEKGWADAIAASAKRVRRDLAYNDQRAVSWHEVQDCAEAISALTPPAQPSEREKAERWLTEGPEASGVLAWDRPAKPSRQKKRPR